MALRGVPQRPVVEQLLGENSARLIASGQRRWCGLCYPTFFEGVVEESFCHASRWDGYGTKVPLLCSVQRCWCLWMSFPSWWLCWSAFAAIPFLSLELAPSCVVPTFASASSSPWSVQLGCWCHHSRLVLCSGYLAACAPLGGYFAAKVATFLWILCRVVLADTLPRCP